MKYKSLIVVLFSLMGCHQSPSEQVVSKVIASDVVYNEDNRLEAFVLDGGFWEQKAKAVAVQIKSNKFKRPNSYGERIVVGRTLGKQKNLCEDERFFDQKIVGDCTGFLISPDILATAGHCVKDEFYCENFVWVFDYKLEGPFDVEYNSIKSKNIYKCSKIIKSVYNTKSQIDYALVQLDRKVQDRQPLEMRSSGKIKEGTKLAVIGHPSGLAQKFANGGQVLRNDHQNFFSANLDTFQRNSGSPVFNEETGLVEGILVRGDTDYKFDYKSKCQRVNTIKKDCKTMHCRLEDITRITLLY
ncbi:MAG: serine protease [Bdellovibrionales bacterium]|nr:serine protease [Bdellovibrionales bacterium]